MPHDAAFEAHEHAEHAAHENDPFVSRATITIAVLAVLAATAGSLETIEAGSAITASSRAVLSQDKATDDWAFYEAKSIKKNLYGIAADAGGPKASAYKGQETKNGNDEQRIEAKAKGEEEERDRYLEASERHETRHHWLTGAATALEIGIAIATVSIITKKKTFWLAAVALGLVGVALGAVGYLTARG
jgi:hypothetical protein